MVVPYVEVSERVFRLADELKTRTAARKGYKWQCRTRNRRREIAVDPPVGIISVKGVSTRRLTLPWALENVTEQIASGALSQGRRTCPYTDLPGILTNPQPHRSEAAAAEWPPSAGPCETPCTLPPWCITQVP